MTAMQVDFGQQDAPIAEFGSFGVVLPNHVAAELLKGFAEKVAQELEEENPKAKSISSLSDNCELNFEYSAGKRGKKQSSVANDKSPEQQPDPMADIFHPMDMNEERLPMDDMMQLPMDEMQMPLDDMMPHDENMSAKDRQERDLFFSSPDRLRAAIVDDDQLLPQSPRRSAASGSSEPFRQ